MRAQPDLPVLVVWGDRDSTPEVVNARVRFRKRASSLPVTTMVHPSAGHAFDAFTKDRRTKRIVQHTIEFRRHSLGADGEAHDGSAMP